jgi:Protein of unknown function (DUF3306)
MANEDASPGFFSRWSRRKAQARQAPDNLLKEDEVDLDAPNDIQSSDVSPKNSALQDVPSPIAKPVSKAPQAHDKSPSAEKQAQQNPLPSMSDVQNLTPESDFSPFMSSEVAPEVKNAAMKKLFADPHFNVMDRMDVYIDDYGQPDPIPNAMLRQLASAKFLNLFDEDEEKNAEAVSQANEVNNKVTQANRSATETPTSQTMGDIPNLAGDQLVAQSVPAPPITHLDTHYDTTSHAHIDLRLQPDPAPRPEGTGSKPV